MSAETLPFILARRKRRAARLRAEADRLDPDGAFVPVEFEGGLRFSVTWESCCQVPYFNTRDTGTPMYHRVGDAHRMHDETTAIPAEHHDEGNE